MMNRKGNPSRQVALDLMLRTFMNTTGFNEMEPKNWKAIARLIPGSTAQECMQRFEELKHCVKNYSLQEKGASLSAEGKAAHRGTNLASGSITRQSNNHEHTTLSQPLSDLTSACLVGQESSKLSSKDQKTDGEGFKVKSNSAATHLGKSPNMVIHVCDEAKNVKKDFTCPRDLLVVEMKYFSEYLSNDAQHWEEVDISVHCDVQIFDWLMRYVKRDLPAYRHKATPCLEAGNVISILISSDFLKMDNLVEDCVQFCHQHMSDILATPCNMNCISDTLCSRIAVLFTDVEIDEVKDRKDRFKSKLFIKKIEQFLGRDGMASTLFRCQYCKRLLTKDTIEDLNCLPNRMNIGKYGEMVYHHKRDVSWDINDYLISLKKELKSWRDVYWRLWGAVNCLECSSCRQMFPCCEFCHCYVHLEQAKFVGPGLTPLPVGVHGCCNQKTLRFQICSQNSGCEVRDHVISAYKEDTSESEYLSQQSKLYNILQSKKDVICTPPTLSKDLKKCSSLNLFSGDETYPGRREDSLPLRSSSLSTFSGTGNILSHEGEIIRDISTDDCDSSDDEVGDEEQSKSAKSRHMSYPKMKTLGKSSKQNLSAGTSSPSSAGCKSRRRQKWDGHRSLRWNQDAQREEDRHSIDDLVHFLTKQRQLSSTPERKHDKNRQKEYVGGVYSKLEGQFKASLNISRPNPAPLQTKPKLRLGQVRAT